MQIFCCRCRRKSVFIISERKFLRVLFLVSIFLTIFTISILSTFQKSEIHYYEHYELYKYGELYYSSVSGELLIDNDNCKIPNVNPYSSEAMNIFRAWTPENCSNLLPLTRIERKDRDIRLKIDIKYSNDFLSWWQDEFTCCYQIVSRSGAGDQADEEYKLSEECIEFESGKLLTDKDGFIMVTCTGYKDTILIRNFKTQIYKNVHATVITTKNVEQKFRRSKTSSEKTNVLLIGIDSISRLNLIRAMPATHDYVSQNPSWIEMKGYTKVGDNTFPNYMAFLTGTDENLAFQTCDPYKVAGIDKCRFLWDDFNDGNYATAYAEDSVTMSSFNYLKKGFTKQPTDYYMRPLLLAASDKLKISRDFTTWSVTCVGLQHYADYIYDYAVDLAENFKNDSYFGLFWTNSFSHEDLSLPSIYDIRMRNRLRNFENSKLLDNTIVIFFADHGMRFGEIRKHFTGWLEERLPFLYIYIPQKFKNRHPDLIENLKKNSNRLTTPFDLYITLKHILKLSGDHNKSLNLSAISCPNCQSLFHEIPSNRSCADASVPTKYCACSAPLKEADKTQIITIKAANFIVKKLNMMIAGRKKCATLKLDKIISSREMTFNGQQIDQLVSISVAPSMGEFEALVRSSSQDDANFELLGDISRINLYGDQSKCIKDNSRIREICYCI